jgi:hypothetical protein
MWQSKDIVPDVRNTQAPDRLVRHYRKIGAPAVAAALNAGALTLPREKAEPAQAQLSSAAPTFLIADDHAA